MKARWIVVWAFLAARLREPSTYLGIGWTIHAVIHNPDMTWQTALDIAAGACGIMMRSPNAPWLADVRGEQKSPPGEVPGGR
jgi:hypothetical protein